MPLPDWMRRRRQGNPNVDMTTAIRDLAQTGAGDRELDPPAMGDQPQGGRGTPGWSPEAETAPSPLPVAARPAPPFPFTPTHAYVYDSLVPGPDGGSWHTESAELMVLGDRAFLRDSWERGAPPDFHIDDAGSWWHETGGHVFGPDDPPTPLLWMDGLGPDGRPQQWLDTHPISPDRLLEPEHGTETEQETAAGAWRATRHREWERDPGTVLTSHEELDEELSDALAHGWTPADLEPGARPRESDSRSRPWSDELEEQLETERDERLLSWPGRTEDGDTSTVQIPGGDPTPVTGEDRNQPDFRRAAEEDRLDALEGRREDEWAARERAAQALERLDEMNRDDWAMEPD